MTLPSETWRACGLGRPAGHLQGAQRQRLAVPCSTLEAGYPPTWLDHSHKGERTLTRKVRS